MPVSVSLGVAMKPARSLRTPDEPTPREHPPLDCPALRADHLRQRLLALPGSAPVEQADPALVRRQSGGVDHGDAVLPIPAVPGLPVCACAVPMAFAGNASAHSWAVAAGVSGLGHAGAAWTGPAPRVPRLPCFPGAVHPRGERGAALLLPGHHRTAPSALVHPHPARAFGVQALRPVQHRVLLGLAVLPLCVGAVAGSAADGRSVDSGLLGVCLDVPARGPGFRASRRAAGGAF